MLFFRNMLLLRQRRRRLLLAPGRNIGLHQVSRDLKRPSQSVGQVTGIFARCGKCNFNLQIFKRMLMITTWGIGSGFSERALSTLTLSRRADCIPIPAICRHCIQILGEPAEQQILSGSFARLSASDVLVWFSSGLEMEPRFRTREVHSVISVSILTGPSSFQKVTMFSPVQYPIDPLYYFEQQLTWYGAIGKIQLILAGF